MKSLIASNRPPDNHLSSPGQNPRRDGWTDAADPQPCEDIEQPAGRLKLGSLLARMAREAGGLTDAEVEEINRRDPPEDVLPLFDLP
ncbi:hypothetical protein [Achromobacter sp.]|uniref:hypothetical protein n=1 Tax=Achromobacter sp. TaxID=134375 RepID=UPI0028A5F5D8|nr:hypothetical protein [Achromobacter sp.]